jgi:tetratricopeptide (TPR) repeat protein
MEAKRLEARRLPLARPTRSMRTRIAPLAFILFALACCVNAQTSSKPQAKSPEEFDDFLDVLNQRAPTEIVLGAKRFAQRWPESALLGQVFRLELNAHRLLGDSLSAIKAGERALKKSPDNVDVLAELAYLMADSKRDAASLAQADSYARRVLALVDTIQISRSVSPRDWTRLRAGLEANAHTTLGLVAFNRGQPGVALEELETAKRLMPEPDPTLFYRLGLLYRVIGDDVKAVEMLQQAARSSDPTLRNLAERQLRKTRAEQPQPSK